MTKLNRQCQIVQWLLFYCLVSSFSKLKVTQITNTNEKKNKSTLMVRDSWSSVSCCRAAVTSATSVWLLSSIWAKFSTSSL